MRAYTYILLLSLSVLTLLSRWVVNGQPPPTALPEGLRGKLAFTKALSGGAMPLHLIIFTAQPPTEQPLAADLRCEAEAVSCVQTKPAWSPDGRYLAYLEGRPLALDSRLFILDTLSGEQRLIADDAWRFDAPVWSPDGKKLLYVADRDGKTVLQQVDLAANTITALTEATDASQFAPTFSPSGEQIAFTEQAAERSQIVLIRSDGQDRRVLAEGSLPVWSPQGDQLVFINRLNNQTALYLITPDGKQLQRLTHGMGDASSPRWSSDGQAIAFVRQDGGERFARLHLIRLADGTERQLADALVLGEPFVWSPDGAFIAFIAPDSSIFTALCLVQVSDGRVFQVVQGGQLSQLAWADQTP
jgi:TolB protein